MICISLLQQEQVCINSELHLWENNSPCAWSWSNGGIIEDINYYIHPTAYDRWSAQEKVCFHCSCHINQQINSTHLCRWAGSLTAAALLSSRWAQRLCHYRVQCFRLIIGFIHYIKVCSTAKTFHPTLYNNPDSPPLSNLQCCVHHCISSFPLHSLSHLGEMQDLCKVMTSSTFKHPFFLFSLTWLNMAG